MDARGKRGMDGVRCAAATGQTVTPSRNVRPSPAAGVRLRLPDASAEDFIGRQNK